MTIVLTLFCLTGVSVPHASAVPKAVSPGVPKISKPSKKKPSRSSSWRARKNQARRRCRDATLDRRVGSSELKDWLGRFKIQAAWCVLYASYLEEESTGKGWSAVDHCPLQEEAVDRPQRSPEEKVDDDTVDLDLDLPDGWKEGDRCKALRTFFGRIWGNGRLGHSLDESVEEEGDSDVINLALDIGEPPKDDYGYWKGLLWAVNRAKDHVGRQAAVQLRRLEIMAKLGKYKWGMGEEALEICGYLDRRQRREMESSCAEAKRWVAVHEARLEADAKRWLADYDRRYPCPSIGAPGVTRSLNCGRNGEASIPLLPQSVVLDNPEAIRHYFKAKSALQQGLVTEALSAIRRVFALEPHPRIVLALAIVLDHVGEVDEAIRTYQLALQFLRLDRARPATSILAESPSDIRFVPSAESRIVSLRAVQMRALACRAAGKALASHERAHILRACADATRPRPLAKSSSGKPSTPSPSPNRWRLFGPGGVFGSSLAYAGGSSRPGPRI